MKNQFKNFKLFILSIFIPIVFFSFLSTAKAEEISVNLTIRNEDQIVFSGDVTALNTISINDNAGNPHPVDPHSVLALIHDADQGDDSWNISNIIFYESFNSLYLKCITHSAIEKCDNWQYAVNSSYPQAGMDQTILSGGENIYVYFGPQNKVILSSQSITNKDNLTVSAFKYDYNNNSWLPRLGITIGVTKPNPDPNSWQPIEVMTNLADAEGKATFSSIPAGNYNVGVQEEGYFPTETLTVTESGGSGHSLSGGSITGYLNIKTDKNLNGFDREKAFEYILSQQKEDGSFGSNLYTDWASFALAEKNTEAKTKLIEYLKKNKLPLNSSLTDYERRAMALMALGLNPYDTAGENYIEKIKSFYNNEQFGDIQEDNDDIFALLVLQNAGFNDRNDMFWKTVLFILKKQEKNGSWNNSVDMTGAGISALSIFKENSKIKDRILQAKIFLKKSQMNDGGWKNASSTAWALEGIKSLELKPETWTKKGKNYLDYLLNLQDKDGGIKNENEKSKLWETIYVLTATSPKTWNQIMQDFPVQEGAKPNSKENDSVKLETQNIYKIENRNLQIGKVISETEIKKAKNRELETKTPEIKENTNQKNWFKNLINKIFNIF